MHLTEFFVGTQLLRFINLIYLDNKFGFANGNVKVEGFSTAEAVDNQSILHPNTTKLFTILNLLKAMKF